jgi:hypothetical protein
MTKRTAGREGRERNAKDAKGTMMDFEPSDVLLRPLRVFASFAAGTRSRFPGSV